MPRSVWVGGVAASAVVLLCSGSASAATAISGAVDAAARTSIGYGPFVTAADQRTDAAAGLPTTLSASARAAAQYGVDSAVAEVSNTAVWHSSNHGQLSFDASWDLTFSQLSTENETAQFGFHPLRTGDWTYTFAVAKAGEITFDYDIISTGQTLGIGGWRVNWRQQGVVGNNDGLLTDIILVDDADGFVRVQGSHSVALAKGATYTFWLSNGGNIGIGGGVGSRSAATSGTIDWRIAAVPEPGAWALMILGFGLTGAAVRRRNALPA
jgi:PEP-CTERM motif